MFRTLRAMALLVAAVAFACFGGCAQKGQQHAEGEAHDAPSAASAEQATGAPPTAHDEAAHAAAAQDVAFAADGSYHAGDPLDLTQAVPLATVLANVDQYAGKPVRIEGEIKDVCSQMGCWMVLQDGDAQTRVTFKDYKFFVPKDATGARASIVAQFSRETMSEEMAKHMASESKEGNPDAVTGPQAVVAVVASAVELHRTPAAGSAPAADAQPGKAQ